MMLYYYLYYDALRWIKLQKSSNILMIALHLSLITVFFFFQYNYLLIWLFFIFYLFFSQQTLSYIWNFG